MPRAAGDYPLLEVAVAARFVLENVAPLPAEAVPLEQARGRALAADLVADRQLPRAPVSAVDGYATAELGAAARLRLLGESAAGRPYGGEVRPGTAVRILTGGVLPPGADRVVMQEDTRAEESVVHIGRPVAAGVNVHHPGADVRAGELVVPAGTELGPAEIGLAGALGHARVMVGRRPLVALMSTGDELVEVGEPVGPGQVPDSNRFALHASLAEAGAAVMPLGIGPDEADALRRLVTEALGTADALVTSGGVSVGTHDLVKPLLQELGDVLVGRVKLKPGKPFTFAVLPDGKRAFGLPGFPVSSLVTFEVFVRPALRRMQGFSQFERPRLPVRLAFEASSPGDRVEYHRCRLRLDQGELVAESTGSQSSSRLLSLAGAQALVRVPSGQAALPAGSRVEAIILGLP